MDPISVADRVPSDRHPVLAFAGNRWWTMSFWPGSDEDPPEWSCAQGDGWKVPTNVTHWLPLPPSPA